MLESIGAMVVPKSEEQGYLVNLEDDLVDRDG
jgi:hypothetical protein